MVFGPEDKQFKKAHLGSRRSAFVIGSTVCGLLLAGVLTAKYGRDGSVPALSRPNGQAGDHVDSIFQGGAVDKVPTVKEFLRGLKDHTNPLTGEPYTEEQIRRIHFLAETFPQNSLIPRPSKEFAEQTEKRTRFMDQIAREMAAGIASPERIAAYFDHAERIVKDRIQIAEFVSGEGQWPEAVRAEFNAVNDQSKKLLERLSGERRAAKSPRKETNARTNIRR